MRNDVSVYASNTKTHMKREKVLERTKTANQKLKKAAKKYAQKLNLCKYQAELEKLDITIRCLMVYASHTATKKGTGRHMLQETWKSRSNRRTEEALRSHCDGQENRRTGSIAKSG